MQIRAQIWDTISDIVPTHVPRHGPIRTLIEKPQCDCDLKFLIKNANEVVYQTDKIIYSDKIPEFFDLSIYYTDSLFKVEPNPKC